MADEQLREILKTVSPTLSLGETILGASPAWLGPTLACYLVDVDTLGQFFLKSLALIATDQRLIVMPLSFGSELPKKGRSGQSYDWKYVRLLSRRRLPLFACQIRLRVSEFRILRLTFDSAYKVEAAQLVSVLQARSDA